MTHLTDEELDKIATVSAEARNFTGGIWWPENQEKFHREQEMFRQYGRRMLDELMARRACSCPDRISWEDACEYCKGYEVPDRP